MLIDALFQLGVVSVSLNTTQTDGYSSHFRECTTVGLTRQSAGMLASTSHAPQRCFILPHAIQIQVYSGRISI